MHEGILFVVSVPTNGSNEVFNVAISSLVSFLLLEHSFRMVKQLRFHFAPQQIQE